MSWDCNDVVEVRYVRDYTVYVAFDNGLSGELDLSAYPGAGPVFEALIDKDFFRRVSVQGGTIAWPNGADIAPERVYILLEAARKVAAPD